MRAQPGGSSLQRAPSSVLQQQQHEEAKTRNSNDIGSAFQAMPQMHRNRGANQTSSIAQRAAGSIDFQAIVDQNQTRVAAAQARNARNTDFADL